jgi:sarcosine oxidase delta subunit
MHMPTTTDNNNNNLTAGNEEHNVVEQMFRENETFYQSKGEASAAGEGYNRRMSKKQRQARKEYDDYVHFNTNWGGGMYGVWEVSTTEAHFELVKGGVFRATPLTDH